MRAFSDWGTDAPLRLWRVGAYAASHIAGGIVGGNQQKTNLTNEDTVRKALSDLLLSADKTVQRTGSATEARHHLAALLADPVIIGGILTVAATSGRELLTLRPRQTDGLAGASDDDWLLDEVIEALEELALLPNNLAAALTVVYSQLVGR